MRPRITSNSVFTSYLLATYGDAIRQAALLPVITGAISGVCFCAIIFLRQHVPRVDERPVLADFEVQVRAG